MTKQAAYVVATVVALVLQFAVAPNVAVGAAEPNFLLIPVLLVALYSGAVWGSVAGFALGLLGDLAGNNTIGAMALVLCLLGLLAGSAASGVEAKNPLTALVLSFAAAFTFELMYGLVVVLTSTASASFFSELARVMLPSALYTGCASALALGVLTVLIQEPQQKFGLRL